MVIQAGLIVYLLLASTAAGLIVTTGGVVSPFIALWMLVAIFAGIFGLWGLLPVLIAIGFFVASEYLGGRFAIELVVAVSFAGILPLVASFIIWHNKSGKGANDSDDRAYRDLANELSQVATQSEVVINAIGDGVMAIDGKGIIQLVNPAAQRILGWAKQDALALSYKSILQLTNQEGKQLDSTTDPVEQVLNTNQQIRNDDIMIITKNGKKIAGSLVISPVGEAGSGAIIVFRDVTKEKAEEREQAEFISTASHEMRTPVASIEGFLGLALNPQTAQIDDKARGFIMKAHESTQHLGRLFQDLLDVSKAEDGRLSNNPKVIDITSFIHDILQGLQQKATEKGLRLVYKPMPDDGGHHVTPVYNVNLDNDHIREIVNNLTENAIKYTPKGTVTVDVAGTDDKVVVSIADSGIGIPTEDIPHLFQKFYRVDNVDTRQIGGTGLGLYLCRRLAEAMGGRIWLESQYQKGSTFYLELPRISAKQAAELSEQQYRTLEANVSQSVTVKPAQPVPIAPVTPQPDTSNEPTEKSVQPVATVPRGESLTKEQIAAQVEKLKTMAKEQSGGQTPEPADPAPATTNAQTISVPARNSSVSPR